MNRTVTSDLQNWLISIDRKPLVIRGARQVGKTWLVRHLAEKNQKQIVELNFEKQPQLASLFSATDVNKILIALGVVINQKIDPNECILFLDEIQAAPQLFSKLRWFAEELPKLPVIAAGSLLEFVLEEHTFSMPVGRISYMHLEPLSFEEFVLANDKVQLYEYLKNYQWKIDTPTLVHEQMMRLFKEYLLIGGMPGVVSNWITENSLKRVHQIQSDLLATYRDDFSKYRGRISIEKLDETVMAIPRMLGEKFVYSHVNSEVTAKTIKNILELLSKARLCHRVSATLANGIPLAAELRDKYFKEIFLDTGLCCAALGLNLNQINTENELIMINNGGIAEQVAGQLLRTINPPYLEPSLYYWLREEKDSNAEVDYIIQHGNQVVPVEIKAGSTGGLKSLHLFMGLKKLPIAVRINSDYPRKTQVKVKDPSGQLVQYKLLSIPFYLIGQIHRLLDSHES